MGGGNNAGMRAAGGRYWFLLNSDAWVRRRRPRAARRVRRRAPARGGRRAAAAQSGRLAPALGPRRADAVAARDRVPRPPQARRRARGSSTRSTAAASHTTRRARSSRSTARRCSCGARRPTAVGPLRRGRSSCSARRPTGCTASAQAGWKVLFYPGAEVVHVGGASHGGRLYVENLRGILRYPRQAPRAARGRACAPAAPLVAAASRRSSSAASGGSGTGTACASSPPGTSRLCFRVTASTSGSASPPALVLLPGWLVARALGQRGAAPTLAWAFAAVFVGLGGHVRRARLDPARDLACCAAIGAAARRSPAWRRRSRLRPAWGTAVLAGGIVLGMLLWHVAGVVGGDGLFHLARVRKLVELGDLHLTTVDEFADGGLHPGYAFPLWHGFLALVAKVSGLDPRRGRPATRRRCSCRSRASSRGRPASPSSAPPRAGSRCSRRRSRSTASRRDTAARYATLALPATGVAAAARAGGVRALLRLRRVAAPCRPGRARGGLRRARARAPDLRSLRAAPARRLRARALPGAGGRPRSRSPPPSRPRCSSSSGCCRSCARRPRTTRMRPRSARARPLRADCSSSTRRTATGSSAEVVGAHRRRRGRRARARAARGSRRSAAALGRVRPRRDDRRARADARAGALHPLLGRRLALAVAARRRLRPVRVRLRGRPRAARALGVPRCRLRSWPGSCSSTGGPATSTTACATAGPAIVTWWAFARRSRGARPRARAAGCRPISERHWLAAAAAALFVLPVAVHGFRHWTPRCRDRSAARSRPSSSRELRQRTAARGDHRRPRDELPHPRRRARVRRRRPAGARRRHDGEPSVRPREGRRRWLATGDPAIPRRYGATWAVEDGQLRRLLPG